MFTLERNNPTRVQAAEVLKYPYIVVDVGFGFILYHNERLVFGCHIGFCMVGITVFHGFDTEEEALEWIVSEINSQSGYNRLYNRTLGRMWINYLRQRGYVVHPTGYHLDRYFSRAQKIRDMAKKHNRLLFPDDKDWKYMFPGNHKRPIEPISRDCETLEEVIENMNEVNPYFTITLVESPDEATHVVWVKDMLPRDLSLKKTTLPKSGDYFYIQANLRVDNEEELV